MLHDKSCFLNNFSSPPTPLTPFKMGGGKYLLHKKRKDVPYKV